MHPLLRPSFAPSCLTNLTCFINGRLILMRSHVLYALDDFCNAKWLLAGRRTQLRKQTIRSTLDCALGLVEWCLFRSYMCTNIAAWRASTNFSSCIVIRSKKIDLCPFGLGMVACLDWTVLTSAIQATYYHGCLCFYIESFSRSPAYHRVVIQLRWMWGLSHMLSSLRVQDLTNQAWFERNASQMP